MMNDNAPTHKRRQLIKTYKNVLPQKRIVVAKVCGETYSKNDKQWCRKTDANVKNNPTNQMGTPITFDDENLENYKDFGLPNQFIMKYHNCHDL